MDELFWYINRKENTKTRENTYVILLISVNPRQIVGYYTGKKRTAEIMQRIVDNLIQAKQYATDGNFTYKDVIFPGKHIQNDENKSDMSYCQMVGQFLMERSENFFNVFPNLRRGVSLGGEPPLHFTRSYVSERGMKSDS